MDLGARVTENYYERFSKDIPELATRQKSCEPPRRGDNASDSPMGNEWKIQTTNHVRVVSMMQQCWEKEAKNCLVIEKAILSLAYS
jgi:hypothetical protein